MKDGKSKFLSMMDAMVKGKLPNESTSIELGTYKSTGILPDSYPSGSDPDDDYYLIPAGELTDGDRVLVIWTDDEEIVAVKVNRR